CLKPKLHIFTLTSISLMMLACAGGYEHAEDSQQNSSATSDGVNLLQMANHLDEEILEIARSMKPGSQLAQQFAAGVISETRIPCPGGGERVRTVDNQGPPWFSTGDIYTTTFVECVQGNVLSNGSRFMSIDEITGQPYVTDQWSSTTTIARQNLVRTNLQTNLSSSADSRATTSIIATAIPATFGFFSYEQESVREWDLSQPNNGEISTNSGSATIRTTYDDTNTGAFTWWFEISAQSSIFGATSAKTLETLQGITNQAPESGRFEVIKTDLGGASEIHLATLIGNGLVLVESDLNGDGIIDSTTETSWNQLLIDPIIFQFF
ncbi:MAG: hypothetical protein OEZ58_10690, partial [Gammaproteobacteria bacterium]|nr:hypothetical protein [Gammaproteobacteria bacterium]